MEVLLNDQIPEREWNEFLSDNPHATPFQSPGFYNLFNSVEDLSAEAIAVTDSGFIRALAVITLQKEPGPGGFFSRRGIIYGGPLIDEAYPEALDMLLKYVVSGFRSKTIYIETRNFSDYTRSKNMFRENGFRYIPYLNFKVNTNDLTAMKVAVSKSRLRQIKKALESSVTWEEAQIRDEVLTFYAILRQLYRDKIGKPLLPLEFFMNFFDRGIGKYLLVRYEGRIIGGIMCPIHEGKAIYELYICGLDNEFREQYPSVMATWAAMEYAFQHHIPIFDFMGAGKPGKSYGVREFKARFGGMLVEDGRFLLINKPLLYEAGKIGLKLIKSGNAVSD